MNRSYRIRRILAAVSAALITFSAAGCSDKENSSAQTETSESSSKTSVSDIPSEQFEVAADDKDIGYDETEAVKVTLDGRNAEISGKGAVCENGVLSISEAGTYILSGDLDGQIYVNSKGSEIKLVLDGVSVSNADHSSLLIEKAEKVTLTINDDTVNSFSDGAEYTLKDSEDNADAAIFSRADLTINGGGTLNVTGNYKHGIVGKDSLVISGGNITVNAVPGGIYGKDCVKISGGKIDVDAGSNGIRATNDEDTSLGFLSISGGEITVNAAGDGIEAETAMQIDGGDISVTTGGGSENASVKSDGTPNEDWGNWKGGGMGGMRDQGMQPPDNGAMDGGDMTLPQDGAFAPAAYITETSAEQTAEDSQDSGETSAKGIKTGSSLSIMGGTISIDSSDDALHSNGNIDISDGVITAKSGDDGAHADAELTISGGTVDIQKSYEGIEGLNIHVSGGEIGVVSSDDGFNAAGGSDTGSADRAGKDGFSESGGTYLLDISGGVIKVNASGDGLDSNGNITISGGEIYVSGPTNNGNGALDYGDFGCSATITGGTIAAAGAPGMAVGFGEESTQYNVLHNFSATPQSGTDLSVTDADGNVLISCTFDNSYQSVVFSCPELAEGTYTVTLGDVSETVEISSICTSDRSGGGFGGGHGGMGRQF